MDWDVYRILGSWTIFKGDYNSVDLGQGPRTYILNLASYVVQSKGPIDGFNCFLLLCDKVPQISGLKITHLCYFSFCESENWAQLCRISGSHTTKVKMRAGLCSHLEATPKLL